MCALSADCRQEAQTYGSPLSEAVLKFRFLADCTGRDLPPGPQCGGPIMEQACLCWFSEAPIRFGFLAFLHQSLSLASKFYWVKFELRISGKHIWQFHIFDPFMKPGESARSQASVHHKVLSNFQAVSCHVNAGDACPPIRRPNHGLIGAV